MRPQFRLLALALALPAADTGQGTRLLRQPTIGATRIAFEYGGDLWIVGRDGGEARRLTSTPAVESDPQLSPDERWVAFTSNRAGNPDVYLMPSEGGDPRRLTWHPAADVARGWSPDGRQVLFSSARSTAPATFARLWTVPVDGGVERLVPAPMAVRGAWSPDGKRLVYDRVSRWDVEFRNYRGGQNTPITILDPASLEEVRLPCDRTSDTQPVWVGATIFFLSDRDYAVNVWAYDVAKGAIRQVTHFKNADVKSLAAGGGTLVIEQDGAIQLLDPATGALRRVEISVHGDFPWAAPRWTDVSRSIAAAALSPTGKRALFEARGDIFTVPVEKGDPRNLTRSPGAADRTPVWSSDGKQVAWFSDVGKGYRLLIGTQDGLTPPRELPIGDAKFAYEAAWSPDGSRIAFTDDKTRVRLVEVATGKLATADSNGANSGLAWSPDSKWLAYSRPYANRFNRVWIWSAADGRATTITDALADAVSPAWDRNGRFLYFLASTDLGLASGWANISSIGRQVTRGAYVALLRAADSTPFPPQSDEEGVPATPGKPATGAGAAPAPPAAAPAAGAGGGGEAGGPGAGQKPGPRADSTVVRIDFEGLGRRIISLQVPVRDYAGLEAGPTGVLFLAERVPLQPGVTLHKYELSKRKAEVFLSGVTRFSLSADGKKLLHQAAGQWSVAGTEAPPKPGDGRLTVALQAQLDPAAEWAQIFDEAWRIERDFFYDPHLHGADWNAVYARYSPLVPFVRHRADLTYLLDQMGGELSVGHSFVGGGDFPAVDSTRVGLLGADLVVEGDRWKFARIYTGESWNPELRAPLDAPGLRAAAGQYLLEINGAELRAPDNPWRLLDGTAERQTVLRINDRPSHEGSWTVTVVPLRSENALRTRAWVEDNRRKVDSLSGGRLGYVWVPNTGGGGYASFNRYFFAQQDKPAAVIDERFNQGGLLDDYMVDYMSRRPIGGVTNEAPGTKPSPLPMAGILGPKVLLVNELAGSGGDYFPWAFRELKVGPLIGTRTWGGLVASCVPYPLVDGGTITSPCAAVFGLNGEWPAEGEGVPADIEVPLDAKSVGSGRDPQLERGIAEALKILQQAPVKPLALPAASKRARWPAP
ncbi:MAG TPA: PDZ domain-containing protein [Gemmatimonadales bacterium]|nr:PDZ domain-containing protein [Gemmatimonadales bacterium]